MPMYEYKCGGCGDTFTMMQRMGEGPEGLSCPACGGRELTKLLSSTYSPDSVKAMPPSMEADIARSKTPAGGCGDGGCSGGSCDIREFS